MIKSGAMSLARCLAILVPLCGAFSVMSAQTAGLRDAPEPNETVAAEGGWVHTIQADLIAERFDALETMAAKYRANKSRLTGGGWRLHEFYTSLDAPQGSDKDSNDHLEHLRHWMTAYPASITPRIAYAISLHRWAWVARGSGEVNTVSAEGWRLFNARILESQQTLEDAKSMKPMCPQWYSEMMTVALAQSWDTPKMKALFEQGIAFEPEYFYLYRQYANYLLPKWDGEPGQASAFARTSADRIGASAGTEAGDGLYFQISTELISRHNSRFPVAELDWPRIQRGYTLLAAQYGATRTMQNHLAFMAYKYRDVPVAQKQFATIGDRWSRSVWTKRDFFDKIRDWAQTSNQGNSLLRNADQ